MPLALLVLAELEELAELAAAAAAVRAAAGFCAPVPDPPWGSPLALVAVVAGAETHGLAC